MFQSLLNSAKVFLVSSTELVIVLNIILLKFVTCGELHERCGYAQLSICGECSLGNVELPIIVFCDKMRVA